MATKQHLHAPRSCVLHPYCQVAHLGRELLQERTRVKALSEELENPLNVHRRAHGRVLLSVWFARAHVPEVAPH